MASGFAGELWVFDLQFDLLGEHDLGDAASFLAAEGNTAVVAVGDHLVVVDLAAPATPIFHPWSSTPASPPCVPTPAPLIWSN